MSHKCTRYMYKCNTLTFHTFPFSNSVLFTIIDRFSTTFDWDERKRLKWGREGFKLLRCIFCQFNQHLVQRHHNIGFATPPLTETLLSSFFFSMEVPCRRAQIAAIKGHALPADISNLCPLRVLRFARRGDEVAFGTFYVFVIAYG